MIYVILVVSLLAIIYGANFLIDGSSSIAKKFNIPDFIIGALIVGVGTSMPELVVSLIGAINDNSDIAIGNVVGSNIFNIFGILGLTAIIFPIPIKRENVKFDIMVCLMVTVMLTLLVFVGNNGMLDFYGGLFLLLLFGMYTFVSIKQNSNDDTVTTILEPLWKSVIKIVGGLAILILGCNYFVDCSVDLARGFGLSDAVISLTLIACGTSLPELAASMVAALKKKIHKWHLVML